MQAHVFDPGFLAHREALSQEHRRQALKCLVVALQALPELRAERFLTTGELWCRVVYNRFRRMQTTHGHIVAPALPRRRAMLVVLSAEDVPALALQRFLDEQSGRQRHQRGPSGPSG